VLVTPSPVFVETPRLILRGAQRGDDEFFLELFNDAAFMRENTDQLRSLEAVRAYLDWAVRYRAQRGFGAFVIVDRARGNPLGLCTVVWQRELGDEHIGYSLLERYRGEGRAFEAASALLEASWARGARRMFGIVRPENAISHHLLGKLGMTFQREGVVDGRTFAWYRRERPALLAAGSPWL